MFIKHNSGDINDTQAHDDYYDWLRWRWNSWISHHINTFLASSSSSCLLCRVCQWPYLSTSSPFWKGSEYIVYKWWGGRTKNWLAELTRQPGRSDEEQRSRLMRSENEIAVFGQWANSADPGNNARRLHYIANNTPTSSSPFFRLLLLLLPLLFLVDVRNSYLSIWLLLLHTKWTDSGF